MKTKATGINQSTSWEKLEKHAIEMRDFHLRNAFNGDKERFRKYSIMLDDQLLFDYSKQRINDTTLELLIDLAEHSQLEKWREHLFNGERINHTENRAVLHTALRDMTPSPLMVDEVNVKDQIQLVFNEMERFVHQVHSGEWRGFTGKCINTIVNIGIGGSDLGPRMLYNALKPFHEPGIRVLFVSNLDGADLAEQLSFIDPETTLFTIASKTFTTLETMHNARSARRWFLRHAFREEHIARHFVAISTRAEKVAEFGIDVDNMFAFWDWVGGRYSLWSAIGLPLALGIGMHHFNTLREGGYAADMHFREAPLNRNIPVIMALTGIWNRNFLGAESLAILPYNHSLKLLPDFLQQLGMESNGKSVDRRGDKIDYATAAIVWGSTGNNGQHAFFQLLHQSKTMIPIDFIGSINSPYSIPGHQKRLFANMIAQSEALMRGKTEQEVRKEASTTHEKQIVPYRVFGGNVPSNMMLFDNLTPYTLGMLVALYEHKVFAQGVIWNINSFDQWGVELGKELAQNILQELPEIEAPFVQDAHDASTAGLMAHFRTHFMDDLN